MRPMLCTLVDEPFDDPKWIFEIKWDGFRALAYKKNSQVHLLSRDQKSFNERFAPIYRELKKVPGQFVLDGEIVLMDEQGRSYFQLLQNYREEKDIPASLYYCVFDIISYQGKDLTHTPLLERKQILNQLLKKRNWKHLRISEYICTYGKKLFNQIKKQNLEGIIAKKKDSFYYSRRSREWLKIKTKMRQEVVIGGFTEPRGSRKYFGSLLVGVYERKNLIYSGHVGGGFNSTSLKEVYQQMKKLISKTCPFTNPPRPNASVTWIEPKLVCEVAFTEWTHDSVMRHPVFQGLRSDKPAKKVHRE